MRLAIVLGLLFFYQTRDEDGLCGPIPENGIHECHCAKMIEDTQAKYQAECRKKPTEKEREACLNSRPETCDLMDYPWKYGAEGHPDQCLRKCKKEACTCNEGACRRPAPIKKKA